MATSPGPALKATLTLKLPAPWPQAPQSKQLLFPDCTHFCFPTLRAGPDSEEDARPRQAPRGSGKASLTSRTAALL